MRPVLENQIVAKELNQMTGPFKFRLSSEHPSWASESSQSASSRCLLFLFLILPVSKDEQNSDLEVVYSWIRFD